MPVTPIGAKATNKFSPDISVLRQFFHLPQRMVYPHERGHRMQNSLYKLFEHKCVLEMCVHIHPIMIKIHPVSTPVQGKTRMSQIKRLRCFVVGCNNEYSSR